MIKEAKNLKQLLRPFQRNKAIVGVPTVLGALSGASIGNGSNIKIDKWGDKEIDSKTGKYKRNKNTNTAKRTLIGAVVGATAGGLVGRYVAGQKDYSKQNWRKWGKEFQRDWDKNFGKDRWQYRQRGEAKMPPPPKTDLESFFKEHGHDHTQFKTKAEAKKVYREAARKHHPDMGGDPEKFKKLSTDWEGIENSEWFHKLASQSLIKLAALYTIEGGAKTDLPNAWKTNATGLGLRHDIKLVAGIPRLRTGMPKLAEKIVMPMSHLKGDHKDLENLKNLGKKIVNKTNEMEAEDATAKKKDRVIK